MTWSKIHWLINRKAPQLKIVKSLTVPAVPRDRWFICWVRGAITPEGWMDKLGSMVAAGVITAPWRRRRDREDLDGATPDKPSERH